MTTSGGQDELADSPEPGPDEIAPLQRGLRNLAFRLERSQEQFATELGAVREQLASLSAELNRLGADRVPAQAPPAEPVSGEQLGDVKELRRQVSELHRSVAELRRAELQPRRRGLSRRAKKDARQGT